MVLSIIVISHNQKEQFRRCIDSILSQDLPFEHEIIVSDDASTDGTWELIRQYQSEYPSIVKAYQCNSNDCNPDMVSERAGFNRINGLKHATGKYLVHMDGDDMLIDPDCLRMQVQTLEAHPECSICCQRYCVINRNNVIIEPLSKRIFEENDILSVDEFINAIPYIHNSACCVRRDGLDPDSLFGFTYDDVDITFSYISRGKVALLNRCGFSYNNTSSGTASDFQENGQKICWLTGVSSSIIAPQCSGSLLRSSLKDLLHVVNLELKEVKLDQCIVRYLSKQPAFIFRCVANLSAITTKVRLRILWVYLHIVQIGNFNGNTMVKILYKLAINNKIPNSVDFSRCV